jgi:hypothetical protein
MTPFFFVTQVFDWMDTDNDGYISMADLVTQLAQLGYAHTGHELYHLMDVRKVGFVTFEQFALAWRLLQKSEGFKALKLAAKMKGWQTCRRRQRSRLDSDDSNEDHYDDDDDGDDDNVMQVRTSQTQNQTLNLTLKETANRTRREALR